jgi:uncharacterized phage infection (PIP) family protein YhgE
MKLWKWIFMPRPTSLEDAVSAALIRIFGAIPDTEGRAGLAQLNNKVDQLNRKVDELMATAAESAAELAEIKAGLVSVSDQLQKAFAEITAKIQALVDAANNAGNTDPAVQAAIDDLKSVDLKSVSQALDDIVPDQPPPNP